MTRHPYIFRPTTAADILELAASLRPQDALELAVSHPGARPAEAILRCLELSDCYSTATLPDGTLLAVFGAAAQSAAAGTATAWALATTHADRHPAAVLALSRPALSLLARSMPAVRSFSNAVWAGNARSRRWLRWLGAAFGPPYAPHARPGVEFIPFTLDLERSLPCAV